jgi:hypothetical protein
MRGSFRLLCVCVFLFYLFFIFHVFCVFSVRGFGEGCCDQGFVVVAFRVCVEI